MHFTPWMLLENHLSLSLASDGDDNIVAAERSSKLAFLVAKAGSNSLSFYQQLKNVSSDETISAYFS